MSDNNSARSGGIGLSGALLLLFIALKLTGHIQWGWLWVLSPMWIPIAVVLAVVGLIVIFAWPASLLFDVIEARRRNRRIANAAREVKR